MGSRSSVAAAALACRELGLRAFPAAALAVALAGCPTVDLGDTPTEIGLCNPAGGEPYFQAQIWPKYIVRGASDGGCAKVGCHVTGGNGLDFPMPVDYPTAYKRSQLYLNCGTPNASPFLTKPLAGIDSHGGMDIFASNADPAVQVFLDWFK
jgi:hypothetical protein